MIRSPLALAAAALMFGSLGFTVTSLAGPAQADSQSEISPDGCRRFRGPDFAAAAAQLGVSEDQLKAALGVPAERPQPDFAGAAAQLGTTEAELRSALRASRGQGRRSFPDLEAVAQQYDVTAAELADALGIPAERQRPDLAAAAAELGVTEAALTDALRSSRCPNG